MLKLRRFALPILGFFLTPVLLCLSVRAESMANHDLAPFRYTPDFPESCYVVYPTFAKAKRSCPEGSRIIESYDFWQNKFLGWACDCSMID